ncbi:TetR/AcrR family transcriptional regulator [Sedimenticola thiotaurini]|uniref:TetR family transcriptional regulator n=1 Tax=Sedimenticola thiotaurini TaxID=1543721 RepID=A0A0F7JZT0_9GAMM|nr:TetR/AcrR family transcriptional regulator [Sedimenticola thiotaurini]AKH21162.1 TetR family transcriptional regulator [Sedimenticola thiotaurini]
MVTEPTDIRQHIIDTANPLILGKGFTAVGLSELLAAAGVPKGSFYHYFKSKEAFGEALLEDYFTDYEARLRTLLKSGQGSGAERLMQYWQLWLETQSGEGTAGKCLAVKLGSEVSDLSESMRTALERGTSRIIQLISECIEEGQADGSLPGNLDAANSALTLYNLWLGATVLTKIRHDQTALEAAMATTRQLLRQTG